MGIYEHAVCRIPNGTLVLESIGDVIVATQENAYPNCPQTWTKRDDGAFCLPPGDWSANVNGSSIEVQSGGGTVVNVGDAPLNVQPDLCDPVYVFGLTLGPAPTTAEWCLHAGSRYAHVKLPAGSLASDYYTGFQVALSAGSR